MQVDLFYALLDKENPRGHPILAALLYAFCPAAARWWLAGADPVVAFDPVWQALTDLGESGTLKETLCQYGFENLMDEARQYVGQVDAYRRTHPGIVAPERMPTFSGGRMELSRRFGLQEAINKFGRRWENFFSYIRTWAFVYPDWEAAFRFPKTPDFAQVRLALTMSGIRRPAYLMAWMWQGGSRTVVGLLGRAGMQNQLRFGLARWAGLAGQKPWPDIPEVWALEWESGTAEPSELLLDEEALAQVVGRLAALAKEGPYPPLNALRLSLNNCKRCGYQSQCYTADHEISPLALSF